MTRENLEEKGFIGNKPIEMSHGRKNRHGRRTPYAGNGVEFVRLLDSDNIDAMEIESLAHYKNVKNGQLIGTRNADEQSAFGPGRNVVKSVKAPSNIIMRKKNGFVFIYKKALHVVPSDVDCFISIRTSADKMRAFMDCSPDTQRQEAEYCRCKRRIATAGISFGIDEKTFWVQSIKQTAR